MTVELCRSPSWAITFCVRTTCLPKIQNFLRKSQGDYKETRTFCEMVTILYIASHNIYLDVQ